MAFYFVDYENVNTEGLQGIEALTASDEVVVFYSEHADRLTFDLHRRINESKAQVSYFKVSACKKNALDFQLVSYLGYLVAQNPGQRFCIISRDTGFQSVVRFWAEQQIAIEQTHDLASCQQQRQPAAQSDPLEQQVAQLVGNKDTAALVTDCLQRSRNKQELHNMLAAALRSDEVGKIYKKVKHLL